MESKEVDKNSINGLILNEKYVPEELIVQILCKVDGDTLMNCHSVCLRWKKLMETCVWRKKAERILCCSLNSIKDVNWSVFCAVCKKKPFERNLVKNCSGQTYDEFWEIIDVEDPCKGSVDEWTVESPPLQMPPLPAGVWPFEEPESCFATSFNESAKKQIIDLSSEGLSTHILDLLQPPIVVSEWYGCGFYCGGLYECSIQLLGDENKVLDLFEFRAHITPDDENRWHHISHVFTNYGQRLKKILFRHAGIAVDSTSRNQGTKMSCATVRVKILKKQESINDLLYNPTEQRESLSMYLPSLRHYLHDMLERRQYPGLPRPIFTDRALYY